MKACIKILSLTVISAIVLITTGCGAPQHNPTPMPPIVPPQQYTEPEQAYNNPGSLYSASQARDLYADNRARRVGDIVLIQVVETSKSKSKADTTANKGSTSEFGVGAALGFSSIGIGKFSGDVGPNPMVSSTSNSSLSATGETKRENYVTATIGARVTQVLPNGVMQIMGAREIRVNDETQYMVVSGLIRSQDVSADNSILSTQMSDSRIDYYGKGVLADKQKSGWLIRLLDNVWPF